jgi:hypothetical protein
LPSGATLGSGGSQEQGEEWADEQLTEWAPRAYEQATEWTRAPRAYEQAPEWARAPRACEQAPEWARAPRAYEQATEWARAPRAYEQAVEWTRLIPPAMLSSLRARAVRGGDVYQEGETEGRIRGDTWQRC